MTRYIINNHPIKKYAKDNVPKIAIMEQIKNISNVPSD